jgi:hypothetical protein
MLPPTESSTYRHLVQQLMLRGWYRLGPIHSPQVVRAKRLTADRGADDATARTFAVTAARPRRASAGVCPGLPSFAPPS